MKHINSPWKMENDGLEDIDIPEGCVIFCDAVSILRNSGLFGEIFLSNEGIECEVKSNIKPNKNDKIIDALVLEGKATRISAVNYSFFKRYRETDFFSLQEIEDNLYKLKNRK